MTLTLAINGEEIHRVDVLNRGTPSAGTVPRNGDGTGLRRYEWRWNGHTGHLVHLREDGALCLAGLVLDAITLEHPEAFAGPTLP